jgi:hypothetical protein
VFAGRSEELADNLEPGGRITFRATVANPFKPGSYTINCGVAQAEGTPVHWRPGVAEFEVSGKPQAGLVALDWTWESELQDRTSATKGARE